MPLTGRSLRVGEVVQGRFPCLTEGESVQISDRRASGDLGIDRLSMSFPLLEFDPHDLPEGWKADLHVSTGEVTGASVRRSAGEDGPLSKVSVFVGVQRNQAGWWGKVEGNPARFADPAGCSVLPLQQADLAVGVMAEIANREGLAFAGDVEDWRVKRLDIARDFRGVAAPEFYVRGLDNVKRPYAKRRGIWSDANCGKAQTLHVGSGAGMVRLYDQHAAYADKGAPEGSLRWEVEAHAGWLERFGVERVRDLSVLRMESAAMDRWEWSRMGTTVTGAANVVEAIDRLVKIGDLSPAKGDRLLGNLVRESLGTSWRTSKTTAAEYERFKRALGVVPSAELFQGADVEVRGRLDFDQGLEVAA